MPTAGHPGGAPGWQAGLVIAGAESFGLRSRFVTAIMRLAALPTNSRRWRRLASYQCADRRGFVTIA